MISREVCELTSRESTDRVADTKRRLALGFSTKNERACDVALATNMISVGLDITRLGLMVVLGQPKAAAEYIQATSRVGRDATKPGLVVDAAERAHAARPIALRAVRGVPRVVLSRGGGDERHAICAARPRPGACRPLSWRWRGTPAGADAAAGAIEIVGERSHLDIIADMLARRARRHRTLTPDEESVSTPSLRGRAQDLLDSWAKIGKANRDTSARAPVSALEGGAGPALLHTPLDPELARSSRTCAKFKAPRSLRDVEPSVNLWLKRLDGVDVELPADGEDD